MFWSLEEWKKKNFKIKWIKIVLYEIMPFAATWMGLEIMVLSEVGQKQKDRNHTTSLISKIWHKWTYLQSRNRLTDTEDKLVIAKGERGGKDWEFGISRCKLLCIGWISNKVLLHNMGNYIQYPVINYSRQQYFKKNCLYVHNVQLYSRLAQHCKSTRCQFKIFDK